MKRLAFLLSLLCLFTTPKPCRDARKTLVSQPRVRSSRQRVAARFAAAAFAVALFVVAVAAPRAQAQSYSVLHNFASYPSDGAYPYAGLIIDSSGNLYGTTPAGGSDTRGVAFKLDASNSYAETVLHNFTLSYPDDGAAPAAGLVMDSSGNLYGTTQVGGSYGNGVVFKLDASNSYAVLHNFTGGFQNDDGREPLAGLVMDSSGNLFGTTASGGSYGNGVVFKPDASNSYAVLHTFTGGADGSTPFAGLVMDSSGNLCGTTRGGGSRDSGVVFKLDASNSYAETVLYNFTGGADGSSPYAGLVMDSSGNLYGTTSAGGPFNYGVVFKLDASSNYAETVLHNFTGGADGGIPFAGLVMNSSGNLYGTTYLGGSYGDGVVFKLDASNSYAETVLHSFTGGADGSIPYAGLVMDFSGNMYGMAHGGGTGTCNDRGTLGCGTVFKIAKSAPNVNGNLAISSGQTYTFVNGQITGNVTMAGGTLVLDNSAIGGNLQMSGGNLSMSGSSVGNNLQISGGGTFSIGPGVTIGGSLQIQNLPAIAGTTNQVCGASVKGSLVFQNSGTAVQIGSSGCAGNTVTGDLQVHNNTAATTIDYNTVGGNLTDQSNTAASQVFNNSVTKNLQCGGNTAITGGGNTASSKQGQCSNF